MGTVGDDVLSAVVVEQCVKFRTGFRQLCKLDLKFMKDGSLFGIASYRNLLADNVVSRPFPSFRRKSSRILAPNTQKPLNA